MKVLIISTNREALPDPVAPLGAAMVGGALKAAGHTVKLLDLQFVPDIQVTVKDACRNYAPQMVALSIRNVDNVAFPKVVSYLPDVMATVKTVRDAGVKLIVAGGAGFTLMPRELMDSLGLNLGIIGEGEVALTELVRRIEKRLPINGLPGLVYRLGDEVHMNPSESVTDLGKLPQADRDLIDNISYMTEGGAGNIQTKRGCRYKCCYCTYPIVEGEKVRLRPVKAAAAEMVSAAHRYGIRHFFVVDNVFNNPIGHAKEFCRELIRLGSDVGWSCYLNPRNMDKDLVDLMVRSGCMGAEFGTDSCDDGVLRALGKGFTARDVIRASELCREGGLRFCHSLLIGSPGETAETVRRTLDVMEETRPNAIIAMLGIRIFPGTRLEKIARKEGVLRGPIGLEPHFYFSPAMDMDAVTRMLKDFGEKHPNFIMPGIRLRMTDKIRKRLRAHGLIGPLWEYLKST